jgi:hypothetical protein
LDFIASLLPHKKLIRSLAEQHLVMLWLSLYLDGYHTNVGISPQTISMLSKLEIELNVEISFLQDIYDGNGS